MAWKIDIENYEELDDYNLKLRLLDSLLKSTWVKKKKILVILSSQMSVKNVKEKGSFYNQYIV